MKTVIKNLIAAASMVLLSAGILTVILAFVLQIIAYVIADYTGAPVSYGYVFGGLMCGVAAMMVAVLLMVLND